MAVKLDQSQQARRDRIRVAVAAYAYELMNNPVMTDAEYDELSKRVAKNIRIGTGNARLDQFFRQYFKPDTGLWIHRHPEFDKVVSTYVRVYYVPKKRRRRKSR